MPHINPTEYFPFLFNSDSFYIADPLELALYDNKFIMKLRFHNFYLLNMSSAVFFKKEDSLKHYGIVSWSAAGVVFCFFLEIVPQQMNISNNQHLSLSTTIISSSIAFFFKSPQLPSYQFQSVIFCFHSRIWQHN